jgi:hypothetical protein
MQPDTAKGSGVLATRSVSQWERALLAQWFAGTDRSGAFAIVAAFVSERSHEDPCRRNMIVIAEHAKNDVAFLVHRPVGETAWIVTCGRTEMELGRYRTLPEALATIRLPRIMVEPEHVDTTHRQEDRMADASAEQ